MRRVSLFAFLMACASLCAQAPIGIGSLLDTFTWFGASPSGCTAGSRGMCVGSLPYGDTVYPTAWFRDASLLPITTGNPVVGTLNDYTAKTCTSSNIGVIQFDTFSWAAKTSSRVTEVNCMASYGSSNNTPAGWFGHCTSGDDGANGCVWHSRSPFVRANKLYLSIMRQQHSGAANLRDITLIRSDDGGATWRNPYTISVAGAASAGGDPPSCGAASAASGATCSGPSYTVGMMWRGVGATTGDTRLISGDLNGWQAVQYGQDWGTGSPSDTMPSGVTDGCDPLLYTCFIGDPLDRSLMRVLNSDLPSLDITKFQYYTCPSITDAFQCDGADSASWSSTFASRTQVGNPIKSLLWSNPVAYIKEFKSYLLIGGVTNGMVFYTAPKVQGPWTAVKVHVNVGQGFGFTSAAMGLGYTVVSTNPPRVQLTLVSDRTDLDPSTQGTLRFDKFDLVLGRTPRGGSQMNQINLYNSATTYRTYGAPLVYSNSNAPRTIPIAGLEWGFDFYDHNGATPTSSVYGMRDHAKDGAMMVPCHGPTLCDWNAGQGITVQPYGVALNGSDGYQAMMQSMKHEFPQTAAIGAANTSTTPVGFTPTNAPAVMAGNGTFSVILVVSRLAASGSFQTPLWSTGTNSSAASSMVALSYPNATGVLELGWGLDNRYRFDSGWTMTSGNWYFIGCTVTANGNTPIAHMWVGESGILSDKLAGVSRTLTGGTPTRTPNVAASPLTIAQYNNAYAHIGVGGLYVYSRAVGQTEMGAIYRVLKAEMARRGVTVQ